MGFGFRYATIANGATVSDAVEMNMLGHACIVGIVTPAGWTTADITIQAGLTEAGTFYDMENMAGTVIKTTAMAADKWRAVDPVDTASAPWVKLKSSASQSSGDIVTLIVRTVS